MQRAPDVFSSDTEYPKSPPFLDPETKKIRISRDATIDQCNRLSFIPKDLTIDERQPLNVNALPESSTENIQKDIVEPVV